MRDNSSVGGRFFALMNHLMALLCVRMWLLYNKKVQLPAIVFLFSCTLMALELLWSVRFEPVMALTTICLKGNVHLESSFHFFDDNTLHLVKLIDRYAEVQFVMYL